MAKGELGASNEGSYRGREGRRGLVRVSVSSEIFSLLPRCKIEFHFTDVDELHHSPSRLTFSNSSSMT